MLTVGSLFSGIGGFDLGLERAGMHVIWQSEIDPFASAVLRKHWPHVPNLGDVRTITADRAERPDVLCGGFPCQDISVAGLGAGITGERSGLWSEFARCIREFRPRYAIVENVSALLTDGMSRVVSDLAEIGYDTEWDCIPAGHVGAPHLRERIFILAYPNEINGQTRVGTEQVGARPIFAGRDLPRVHVWLQAASEFIGMDDGISHRAYEDRVGSLGNAIVPQIAEIIGRAIVATTREQIARITGEGI